MAIGKILLTVALIFFSCSKKNGSGDFCWSCEVTGGGQTRMVDTCTRENKVPQFQDANGNDLNVFCTKR